MSIFAALDVYPDVVSRSAAMNMAIDEALLEIAAVPSIRFYRWDHPALSFGYFGRVEDLAEYSDRDCVRRWTGGGIVLHGEDLTYGLVIPANDEAFAESSTSIYEKVHCAIRDALAASGTSAQLVSVGSDAALRRQRTSQRDVPTGACFANPVRADVMLNGLKIAGAAQRRTKRGLLQQGSIQNFKIADDLAECVARELSSNCHAKKLSAASLESAKTIAAEKYATDAWLRRR